VTNRQSRFVGSRIRLLAFVLIVPVILSLDSRGVGETVFMNARILSMAASDRVTSLTDIPYYEAMLVRNGRIVQLGSNDSVLDAMSSAARLVDLDERAVLPGFVDAHSHFPVSGLASVSVNVAPPPSGPGGSKEAVLSAIAAAVPKEPATTDAHFILGFNYDNTAFSVPEHPTRAELDAISNGYPVYLWHSSGHLGVANSAALQALNIDEQTEAVIGGERRRDASGRLNGLLLEHAAPSMTTLLKQLSWRERWRIVTAARDEYLMNGVTTVQNGFASTTMQRLLNALHSVKLLPQRPHSWLAHKKLDAAEKNQLDNTNTIKIIVDGSPQGLTAYLTEPYAVPAFGRKNAGFPIYYLRCA